MSDVDEKRLSMPSELSNAIICAVGDAIADHEDGVRDPVKAIFGMAQRIVDNLGKSGLRIGPNESWRLTAEVPSETAAADHATARAVFIVGEWLRRDSEGIICAEKAGDQIRLKTSSAAGDAPFFGDTLQEAFGQAATAIACKLFDETDPIAPPKKENQ